MIHCCLVINNYVMIAAESGVNLQDLQQKPLNDLLEDIKVYCELLPMYRKGVFTYPEYCKKKTDPTPLNTIFYGTTQHFGLFHYLLEVINKISKIIIINDIYKLLSTFDILRKSVYYTTLNCTKITAQYEPFSKEPVFINQNILPMMQDTYLNLFTIIENFNHIFNIFLTFFRLIMCKIWLQLCESDERKPEAIHGNLYDYIKKEWDVNVLPQYYVEEILDFQYTISSLQKNLHLLRLIKENFIDTIKDRLNKHKLNNNYSVLDCLGPLYKDQLERYKKQLQQIKEIKIIPNTDIANQKLFNDALQIAGSKLVRRPEELNSNKRTEINKFIVDIFEKINEKSLNFTNNHIKKSKNLTKTYAIKYKLSSRLYDYFGYCLLLILLVLSIIYISL